MMIQPRKDCPRPHLEGSRRACLHIATLPDAYPTVIIPQVDKCSVPILVFEVSDLDDSFRHLTSRGTQVVTPPETEPWGER
jgi:uncharacterized glyoxalase superfamily protein PhnB